MSERGGNRFVIQRWCALAEADVFVDCSDSDRSRLLSADEAMDVSFLPAMRRRRLSALSKMALRLAHECAPNYSGHGVFGSQHGELPTTQRLLEQIVRGETVSPAGFSASVHNTAAGLHSINTQNTSPYTSVAAGADTLMMSFLEAGSILLAGAQQVLLVYVDDLLPSFYDDYTECDYPMSGFAALITSSEREGLVCRFTPTDRQNSQYGEPQARQLTCNLLNTENTGESQFTLEGEKLNWMWSCHAK